MKIPKRNKHLNIYRDSDPKKKEKKLTETVGEVNPYDTPG